MPSIISADGLIRKGPGESEVYFMDWDLEHLRAGLTITTSTWSITGSDAVLTKDSESKLTAAQATTAVQQAYPNRTVTFDDRVTQVRLIAGTLGAKYKVTNRIVTNESPTRTKDRSFQVLIEAR